MKMAKIIQAQDRATKKFELAKQIRELLDKARAEYGAREWDDEDMESQIVELVTEE